MSTLEKAIAIAAEAHAGRTDKAGVPYILHPLRLMLGMTSTESDPGGHSGGHHARFARPGGELLDARR